ncbi:Golgi apparatus membrane protein tvp18 [Xylographa soralifera]|nr:Golgi apparatus membrane protein tvp18 [Xylographa soralifera]
MPLVDEFTSTFLRPILYRDQNNDVGPFNFISGLILIFLEIPLLLRICPTSPKFDEFMRRFTTNYMRATMYGVMSLVQWLSLIVGHTSLIAAAVFLLFAAVFYLIAGVKGQDFSGSKTLGGHGVAQMIV